MSESTRITAAETSAPDRVHVAVAAILNDKREVLLSLRPDHVHQGGLWEFPGGKVEPGESLRDALTREIHEELGIQVQDMQPLIRIPHCYSDKSVLLDVWMVDRFDGEPHGREGQPVEWVAINALSDRAFPEANKPIIHALQLPAEYLITPQPAADRALFLEQLWLSLVTGVRLVQLRADLPREDYVALARHATALCHERGAQCLLNADPALAQDLGADGVHLNNRRLWQCERRPLSNTFWVAASCHTPEDLRQAERIAVDFAVLSPVRSTATHAGAEPLGWTCFSDWADQCPFPVYALGGMTRSDIATARQHGGQGVAAIRALWRTR